VGVCVCVVCVCVCVGEAAAVTCYKQVCAC
jgi:hypothetical protein